MRLQILASFATCLVACASTPAAQPTTSAEASADEAADSVQLDSLGLDHEQHPTDTLITGGQPTEEVLERAKQSGVELVVRLRTAEEPMQEEERQIVEALGMRYAWIPVAGADGLTEENARALDEALEGTSRALVHCGSGNRAGALLALRAYYVQGKSAQEAIELGRAAGMTALEGAVREQLSAAER